MDQPLISEPLIPYRSGSPLMLPQQHRILLYTTCYNVLDGVTLTIRKIEQEILAAGHHVCILTTKSGRAEHTHCDGEHPNRQVVFLDNAVALPFTEDVNNPDLQYFLGFSLSQEVKAKIAEFEPSLIHVTVPDCTCLHLIQYARKREIPIMGTYHSNIPDYMSHYKGLGWLKPILVAFFRHQYNFLQALYVPTPFIHKYLSDSFKFDRVTNLQVWGRGIDLERFSPKYRSRAFRQRMGFDENDVVICWIGRLVPEKRPDIFCRVVRRLHDRNVPFKALVVGAGPCEPAIKALPNTTFSGWLSGDDLSAAYASSDIFLFPSGVETFGNVTLEAAASGLPLVVEAGCSGHLINRGLNGFACHEYDEDSFFEATLTLVLDDKLRKSMSKEGRKLSLKFEKRAVCQQMLENYALVTNEFYCEYGGHHANRDIVYQNEDSFVGGTHPRPYLLRFVEVIFIAIFQIAYYSACFVAYWRQRILCRQQKVSEEETAVPMEPPVTTGQASALSRIVEEDDGSGYDSDARVGDNGMVKEIVITKVGDDDNTDSTTSLSDTSASSKRSEKTCPVAPPQEFMNMGDSLALAFVYCMQFQFRMEGHIRGLVSFCSSPATWSLAKRKRKNSSLPIESPGVSSRVVRSQGVVESRAIGSTSARDERLSMRRSAVEV